MTWLHKNIWQRNAGRRAARCAAACLLVILLAGERAGAGALARRTSSVCGTAGGVSAATREGRLLIFDEVWETIRERYYDPALHGVDWQALRTQFRPLAAGARDGVEFYALLRRMINRLRDAHTRVYAPDERFDWRRPRFVSVGVRLREIGDELVVANVDRGTEAERGGVRAGDTVMSIDGVSASAVLARRIEEHAGSSLLATARRQAVARLFDGPRDTAAAVTFRSYDGRNKTVKLWRILATRTPLLRVRRAGVRHSVAQFDSFTPEIAAALARALRSELRDARGLILDLRDNGGGEAEALTDITSLFLPAGKSLGYFTDREGRLRIEPQTRRAMLSAADALTSFRGSLIILTSGATASAAEIFVAALQEANRALVIGEETCGCVLATRRRHVLPDGGTLDVSEMDYRTARGIRIEGRGLTPNITTAPTRHDLRARRDVAMERAIDFLKAENKD